ncbi:hypothetical protein DPM19_15830 [Actinomadura craniellae]|uniref:Uncharacterized protein n=1 Tax=Actinomadura craniellae TaxID=2231787 RepID=A0A365H602_9ACTN|nr:hypothetical protein [Actinomadura craniellae]RAY14426.1 hypothetical protein DPM19_15830 [Actinomadura craniellae]
MAGLIGVVAGAVLLLSQLAVLRMLSLDDAHLAEAVIRACLLSAVVGVWASADPRDRRPGGVSAAMLLAAAVTAAVMTLLVLRSAGDLPAAAVAGGLCAVPLGAVVGALPHCHRRCSGLAPAVGVTLAGEQIVATVLPDPLWPAAVVGAAAVAAGAALSRRGRVLVMAAPLLAVLLAEGLHLVAGGSVDPGRLGWLTAGCVAGGALVAAWGRARRRKPALSFAGGTATVQCTRE